MSHEKLQKFIERFDIKPIIILAGLTNLGIFMVDKNTGTTIIPITLTISAVSLAADLAIKQTLKNGH